MKTYKNPISTAMSEYREDFHYNKEWWAERMGTGNNNEYLWIQFKNGDNITVQSDYFQYDGNTCLPRFRADEVAYISRYYGDGVETTTAADIVVDTDRIILYRDGVEYFRYEMTEEEFKEMRRQMWELDSNTDSTTWMLDYCRTFAASKINTNTTEATNNTPATMNANEPELTAKQAAYYNAMLTPSDESASLAWESEPKTDEELTALGVDAFGDNENANEIDANHISESISRLRYELQEYHNNASKGGANRQRNMAMLAEDIARLEASANKPRTKSINGIMNQANRLMSVCNAVQNFKRADAIRAIAFRYYDNIRACVGRFNYNNDSEYNKEYSRAQYMNA